LLYFSPLTSNGPFGSALRIHEDEGGDLEAARQDLHGGPRIAAAGPRVLLVRDAFPLVPEPLVEEGVAVFNRLVGPVDLEARPLKAWCAIISNCVMWRPDFPTLLRSLSRMQGWLMQRGLAGGGTSPLVTKGWKSAMEAMVR